MDSFTEIVQEPSQDQPAISVTSTEQPQPLASTAPPPDVVDIIPPTSLPTSSPTQSFTPTPEQACNAVELVAQSYQLVSEGVGNNEFDLTLRLTNIGSCTWTLDYAVVLVMTLGSGDINTYKFTNTAVPGQTIDLLVTVTVPADIDAFSLTWLLQDAEDDFFGDGPLADQLFTLAVLPATATPAPANGGGYSYGYPNSPGNANWVGPSETCGGLATQKGYPRYARLMHDPQWMPWPSRMYDPDWANGYHYDWYPETVQLWTNPKGGDGRFNYSIEWLQYLRVIQPNDETAVWIARIAAGLFNRTNDPIPILNLEQMNKEPVAESISSGGNVVKIVETKNGSARIEMLYAEYTPPSPSVVNYQLTPWLITKFTSVSKDGQLGNAGGIDVYFPNLARQKDGYWVDMDRIEIFPKLPICATVKTTLVVYNSTSIYGSIYGKYAPGDELLIREYLPQGSDVWGRTAEGWVLLVYQIDGQPVYPTSWQMQTRPPIMFFYSR